MIRTRYRTAKSTSIDIQQIPRDSNEVSQELKDRLVLKSGRKKCSIDCSGLHFIFSMENEEERGE